MPGSFKDIIPEGIESTADWLEQAARFAAQGPCGRLFTAYSRQGCTVCNFLADVLQGRKALRGRDYLEQIKEEMRNGEIRLTSTKEFMEELAQRIGMSVHIMARVNHGPDALYVTYPIIAELPEEERKVLFKLYFQAESVERISLEMNVSEAYVHQTQWDALDALRNNQQICNRLRTLLINEPQQPVVVEEPQDLYDEHLLSFLMVRVDDMEISVRAANCLHRRYVLCVAELLTLTEKELVGIKNCGHKCLREIKEVLTELAQEHKIDPVPLLGSLSTTDTILQEALRRLDRQLFGGRT